jgi:hypothetical protein
MTLCASKGWYKSITCENGGATPPPFGLLPIDVELATTEAIEKHIRDELKSILVTERWFALLNELNEPRQHLQRIITGLSIDTIGFLGALI